jgi:hypothetical protein
MVSTPVDYYSAAFAARLSRDSSRTAILRIRQSRFNINRRAVAAGAGCGQTPEFQYLQSTMAGRRAVFSAKRYCWPP